MNLIKIELTKQFSYYNFDSIMDSNMKWSAIKGVINLCLDKIAPVKQINVGTTVA